jgi:hypothetical protein
MLGFRGSIQSNRPQPFEDLIGIILRQSQVELFQEIKNGNEFHLKF